MASVLGFVPPEGGPAAITTLLAPLPASPRQRNRRRPPCIGASAAGVPFIDVAGADVRNTDSFGETRTIPKKVKPRPLSDGLGFCVIAETTPDESSGMSATVALASSSFWREFEPSTRVTGYSTARGATSRSRSALIATGASVTARPRAVSNSG